MRRLLFIITPAITIITLDTRLFIMTWGARAAAESFHVKFVGRMSSGGRSRTMRAHVSCPAYAGSTCRAVVRERAIESERERLIAPLSRDIIPLLCVSKSLQSRATSCIIRYLYACERNKSERKWERVEIYRSPADGRILWEIQQLLSLCWLLYQRAV